MRVWSEAYGCTLNQGETAMVLDMALRSGHTLSETLEDANLVILGSCIVIDQTERKMWRRLRAFSGKKLVVVGCLPPVYMERLLSLFPDATVVPPGRMEEAARFFGDPVLEPVLDGVTATIPISTGCLGQCTYCITRVARGSLISRDPNELLSWVKNAVDHGAVELRLSAQDTGVYGMDRKDGPGLPDLLRLVSGVSGDFRIRIGMMTPNALCNIKDGMVDAYNTGKLYKFLHIPVQSGSDRILAAMGRSYTAREALELAIIMREKVPGLTISTDIIVGFPGETEEDFKSSLIMMETMRPDVVNVTRFSPRPSTPSQKLQGQVVGRIVKERSREMTKLRFRLFRERHSGRVGEETRALVVENGTVAGTVMARTENYLPVVLSSTGAHLGQWVDLKFTGCKDSYLQGVLVR